MFRICPLMWEIWPFHYFGPTGVVIATGLLAWFTFKLAKSAADGNRQADKHHQQNLRPFCVIEFSAADHLACPFGVDFDPATRRIKSVMGVMGTTLGSDILIRGELKNKAPGLAKDVVIYLNARRGTGDENVYRFTRPVIVAGLVGGEETVALDIAIKTEDVMQVLVGTEWKDTLGIEFIPAETYEVVLEYKDVFENIFRTVHPRGVWHDPQSDIEAMKQKDKQQELLVRLSKPMPIFLTGAQSVRTLADLQTSPQLSQE